MNKSILCSWIFVVVTGNEVYKNYAEKGGCGVAFILGLRIVGGVHAKKSEFPWIVSLTRRGGHICGGSIISEKFVVTAAHCLCSDLGDYDFFHPKGIKVVIGQHNINDKNSDAYKMGVTKIIIHDNYTCGIPKDDIALLELENKLKWSKTVAPVCVSTVKHENAFDHSLVTVAGWGWTHENHAIGQRSDVLRKADVWVINKNECRQWYKENKKHLKILDTHLCAGHRNGGIDACWADSGGPLVKQIGLSDDKMMIIGVVSTGRGCGRPHLPGIYTRISDYISWIDKIV